MDKTYKTYEILKYFEKYQGKEIKIDTNKEDINFDFLFNKYSLPHLLGLHYQYRKDGRSYFNVNNEVMTGRKLYDEIINKKISDQEILNKISVNTKDYMQTNSVKQRIETFLEFMQNLEKGYIVENTSEKSDIKSNYIIVEDKNKKYHHLFIMKTDNGSLLLEYNDEKSRKYLETYFVRNNDKYFNKSKIKENIKSIEVYDEKTNRYIPFSFDEEKQKILNQQMEKENKEEKEMDKNTVGITGNVTTDIELTKINIENKEIPVANFTIVTKNENGEKEYHKISAYDEEKVNQVKDFQKGDFVNIFGVEKITKVGEKEYKSIRALKSSLRKSVKDKGNKENTVENKEKENINKTKKKNNEIEI